MKQGQVEVSYNWIFVLVAGAALFGFLIFLVASERDATEQRIANQYTNNLYNLINLQYQDEPGSSETLQTYSETFEFFCDAGGHGFRIEGGSTERTFETQPVFTPPQLSGDVISQNLEYKMPFHLSPLLLVTDSNTKYYFIDDQGEDTMTRLYSQMANEFDKEILSSGDYEPTHRTNIVIAHPDVGIDAENIVTVKQTDSETVSETFRAYNVTIGGESYELLGASLVLSSIITGNQSLFQCGLDKVRQRANKTLQLKLERSKQIKDDIEPDDFEEDCKSVFNVSGSLKGVIPLLTIYSDNIGDIGRSKGVLLNVTKIDKRDEELGRFSCPRVY